MIYFIRHGESEANAKGLFAGQRENCLLTDKGREQARAAAQAIKDKQMKIDVIISSPLHRALETAQIVAGDLGHDTEAIVIEHDLREYDMGDLSGTIKRDIPSIEFISGNGAEDPEHFKARIQEAINRCANTKGDVLIVAHAAVRRMIETIKIGGEAKYFYDLPGLANATVGELDWIQQI